MISYAAPANAKVLTSIKRTVYAIDAADFFRRKQLHHAGLTYNVLQALGMLLGDTGAGNPDTPDGFIRVDVAFFSMYNGDYHDIVTQQQLIPADYTPLTDRDLSLIEVLLMDAYHWQKTPFTDAERNEFFADFNQDEPDTPAADGVFEWGYTIIKK